MARPDSAGRSLPETQHEPMATVVFPACMVLRAQWPLGSVAMRSDLDCPQSYSAHFGGHVDRYTGGRSNLNLPPADDGHKPSP